MRIVQRINLGNRRQMGETDLNLGALPGGFGGLRAGRDLIAYPNLRGLRRLLLCLGGILKRFHLLPDARGQSRR